MQSAEHGFPTPEEAASYDIPKAFVHVLGSRLDGDRATVWLFTNDRPAHETYTVWCERRDSRWHQAGGSGGFSGPTPAEVLARARELGW